LGDFQVYVTVNAVDVNFLQKCRSDVEHLKFVSSSGWVDGAGISLRPAVNRVYRRLDRDDGGDRHMFFSVPIIGNIWLERCASTDILRLHFTYVETPARQSKPANRTKTAIRKVGNENIMPELVSFFANVFGDPFFTFTPSLSLLF
jgi:hypothetical protein